MMKLRGMMNKLVEKMMDASNYASNEYQDMYDGNKTEKILDKKIESSRNQMIRTMKEIENEIEKLNEMYLKVNRINEYVMNKSVDMWNYYLKEYKIISEEFKDRIVDSYRENYWKKTGDY